MISSGTLQIGNAGTTGSLATTSTITDNGNLTFNRTNTVTQADRTCRGAADHRIRHPDPGAGRAAARCFSTAANTYTGGTIRAAGTLDITNSGTWSSPNSATGTGTFVAGGARDRQHDCRHRDPGDQQRPSKCGTPVSATEARPATCPTTGSAPTITDNAATAFAETGSLPTRRQRGQRRRSAGPISLAGTVTIGDDFGRGWAPATSRSTGSAISNGGGAGASLAVAQIGTGTTTLGPNSGNGYAGTTSATAGELILNSSNTGTATASATNAVALTTTVLSLRNANALGAGSADTGLAPITHEGNEQRAADLSAVGSRDRALARLGTDPGGLQCRLLPSGRHRRHRARLAARSTSGPWETATMALDSPHTTPPRRTSARESSPCIHPLSGARRWPSCRKRLSGGKGAATTLCWARPQPTTRLVLLEPDRFER